MEDFPHLISKFDNLQLNQTSYFQEQNIQDIENMKIVNNEELRNDLIINDKLAMKVFQNREDILSSSSFEDKKFLLGIPNKYCKIHFDDEDFIYTKMGFCDNILDNINLDVIKFINSKNIILDYSENSITSDIIYAKVINLFQFVKSYYTSLSCMRPSDRVKQLPHDLLLWCDNTINLIRYLLENNLFNYPIYVNIDEDNYNELIFGLNLIICHIKMIINHCKINRTNIWELEDKNIRKLFRLLNNMSIIIIYLYNLEFIESQII